MELRPKSITRVQVRTVRQRHDAAAGARRAACVDKTRIEAEVAALTARRDELHAEATRLERHIGDQRERIGAVAGTLRSVLSESSGLVLTDLAPPSPSLEGADG